MEYESPAPSTTTVRTSRIAAAIGITLLSTAATTGLCVGSFLFGVETSRAKIFENQVTKLEVRNAGLMRVVGIVDRAKANELISCAETGRSDCLTTIEPVLP